MVLFFRDLISFFFSFPSSQFRGDALNPQFQVYLLGNKAEGKLARPWKPPPGPFAAFMPEAPKADEVKADVEVKALDEKKDD